MPILFSVSSRGNTGSRSVGTFNKLVFQSIKSRLQGFFHDHLITDRDDTPRQLRHFGLGGQHVDGLYIEDGIVHGQNDHPAFFNFRAQLVPQGKLGGDFRVLVYQGVDLRRAVNLYGFGEFVYRDAGFIAVVAIVLIQRAERLQVEVALMLGLIMANSSLS